ncbi:MAG: HEAT repeat domain-containing protein [Elusimicrobia bacterium]|nr:HEAT repeat domain-containing protein [Elusimicrobiota bacterium]
MKRTILLGMSLLMLQTGPLPAASIADNGVNPNSVEGRTGVAQVLVDLLQRSDKIKIDPNDYESTSLKDIITFGTPAGFRLKIRYLDFGVALVEALKSARDPDLRKRLIEMAQWTHDPKVRAEAVITLASLQDPSHKRYLKEALLDSNVGIRFAALEALQRWGLPEAVPLIHMAMVRDWSPLMQVYAAQALLSLGDESGLATLWQNLDHNSWVVRAMAARYLGDYASPDDYPKLVTALNRESKNDYVTAELAVAALKLISRKGEKVSYSPASKGWKENDEVRYTIGKDQTIELEPLIIVPPQLRIPPSLQAAAQINQQLLRLMRDRLTSKLEPAQAQDPLLQELNSMVTPTGFALKTRYSELSYLLVEGLAGTNDEVLGAEIRKMAAEETNPLIRATALLAIAYKKDENDINLFQDALNSKNPIVRMGALECIDVGRFKDALPTVAAVSGSDPSAAIQIYALQIMAKFGDQSVRQILMSRLNDPDWPARAMTYWTLSRYGDPEDYGLIQSHLASEQNPFVQAEIALACLKLTPLK